MPRNITITFSDGTTHVYNNAPDDVTPEQVSDRAQKEFGKSVSALDGGRKSEARSFGQMFKDEAMTSLPGGFARGVKDVIDTGAAFASRLAGPEEAAQVQAENDAGKADFKAAQERAGAGGSNVARVGGNIAATIPLTNALGGVVSTVAPRLGSSIASGGFSLGGASANTMMGKAGELALRSAGGGIGGLISGGAANPEQAGFGAAVGAALPPAMKVIGAGTKAVGSLINPFLSTGQSKIVGDTLRGFASNPEQALQNLGKAAPVVEGSAPTTVMAAGDEGLAGLSRTLQSSSPQYAAELSTRSAAQNAARTKAIEALSGNTGKIAVAEQARDQITAPMREAVLDAAGKLPAAPVLQSIDKLLSKPDNAGKISQAALSEVRSRIAQFAPDGNIDARALYAIRKDINDTLSGKLQGEAGNMRLASSQLIKVKELIDDAIDRASRVVQQSSGTALADGGGVFASQFGGAARPSWRQYLQEYASQSKPIDQMKAMEDVLNAARTGTVDQSGNAVLSAAKLNNLLKNRAKELSQTLSAEQLDTLRKVAADLNASQLANNAGRAVGSNTVQNLASNNLMMSLLGPKIGQSAGAQSALGRVLQLPYGASNKIIQEKLGEALLDPAKAEQLMKTPEMNKLAQLLINEAGPLGYKAAPVIGLDR